SFKSSRFFFTFCIMTTTVPNTLTYGKGIHSAAAATPFAVVREKPANLRARKIRPLVCVRGLGAAAATAAF
ncbi:hypothetical protein B0H17DRAFT_1040072, partial [Mycena rosella]